MKFETKCIHAGQAPDPSTGAIMTPVYMTSTYAQEGVGKHKGYEYSRTQNPTRKALEECVAALEEGRFGLAFSSGCGAATTLLHMFEKGDHVVSCNDVYGGTYRLFEKAFRQLGLSFTFVDMRDLDRLEEAMRKETKMVWIETPTNPLLRLVDIQGAAAVAKKYGALTVVDNTFMTPYFQKPLLLGADMAIHSTTKYLNGHSDVVGGVIVTSSEETARRLYFLQNALGAVPGPMDCFLVLRGIKTLPVRMAKHEENAMAVASFLESHEEVEKVIYPGLESHPQHALARRQMAGSGGMISFVLKGDLERAKRFVASTEIFSLAESLGGVESLIELPAAMTHASIPQEVREKTGIPDGLIRLSVGIENRDDLIEDLQEAFRKSR